MRAFAFLATSAHACTLIAVGSKATIDGSAMVAHTNDGMPSPNDLRLVRVPAMNHSNTSQRSIYNYLVRRGNPRLVTAERGPGYMPRNGTDQAFSIPTGYIPQVPTTYAYWDHDFGMQNEVQLSIGESTCAAKTVGYPVDVPNGRNLFDIDELSKIALERCDTAVCAVKTMGALAEEFGFYGEYSKDPWVPAYAGSAEALIIADKYQNVWIFHILTGAHNSGAIWAAQRLGDDQFTIVPNTFVIRTLNLTDSANYLASPNVSAHAYAQGWASPEEPFDFTAAYGYATPNSSKPLYGGRRMWRAFSIVAPSVSLDPDVGFHVRVPTYPLSIKPDVAISPEVIMNIFSDYYQNTTYDLAKGVAAGPFHDPVRYTSRANHLRGNWERSMSLARTTHSFVLQTRPNMADAIGGVAWYAQGVPADSVYFPISCGQTTLPTVFNQAIRSKFDTESTWWAFQFTTNWAHLRYDLIHHEIQVQRIKYTTLARELQQSTEATCRSRNLSTQDCVALVESAYNEFIETTTKAWWQFAWRLVSSFNAGYEFFNESATGGRSIGYPADWANQTEYVLYPQHYHPPAQVAAEENRTAAVDPDTGVLSIVVGGSSAQVESLSLSSDFLLGFVCGTMSLSLVVAAVALVSRVRQEVASPKAPASVEEQGEPAQGDNKVVAATDSAIV
ncbi:hypothetical protein DYB26_001743 [Aphanomyces astaci]|uniref:Peptidase n=2 Tax=Aphanomyces astaci TaxID=112090 RepID=A0A3R6ZAN6_APHAT|nr:hypothetical protein DYB34_003958 [Aphanomyces astaci]RHZ29416.1 hypothetical protein DYB26_001743 [Aphanomyces astaci]